jgi:hypothetical protein
MKNVLKTFGLMLFCICFSCAVFAQSESMGKLFHKYEKKRHFEKFEYGEQKPVWLNLIAHNASFVKILTCDAKPKSHRYKKFNQDIRKSMENFNIVFELNEGDYLLKICATEKDEKGCSDYVVVTRLGDKERVIWLYGRTNIKKFIEYVKEALM